MFDFSGSYKLLLFIQQEWKLLSVLTIIFALYFYYTSTFDFFEKKGVKFMKPVIFLGNLGPRLTSKLSFHDFQLDVYKYFKGHPYGGMFEGRRPVLYIFDPDLIKAVGIKDFDHFVDRNTLNSKEPFFSRSLLNLKGKEWKDVRSILTPTFSSSRLRNMLPLMQQCCSQMVDYLKQYDKKDIEMKDTMGHFTLEVIGACAFGIKCDALKDESSHFIKVAEKFNHMSVFKRITIFALLMFAPKLFSFFNISFLNKESSEELLRVLSANKEDRRKNNIRGSDFLQILLDAAEKERMDAKETGQTIQLDDNTIDAQSLLFLFAGYETSSTLLSFAIHVLATKPELQTKLRQHILDITDGKEMSYELLGQMTYLEGFLLETLRMYPPVSRVDRVCTKPYTLPGTSIDLEPGNVVVLPVYGIHMDADYYPDPQEFRPERFMGEEKHRPSHLFIAFGVGPRNCIGLRFAMLSAKLAMASLLREFSFKVCEKTVDPIPFEKRGILLKAAKGLWVNIEARGQDNAL